MFPLMEVVCVYIHIHTHMYTHIPTYNTHIYTQNVDKLCRDLKMCMAATDQVTQDALPSDKFTKVCVCVCCACASVSMHRCICVPVYVYKDVCIYMEGFTLL